MRTYKIKIVPASDPNGTLDRGTAFGDLPTWLADRREAERILRQLETTGDWPEGQRPGYWIVETNETAWEWGTGFGDDFVGPPSELFPSKEAARKAADDAGYGDHEFLMVRQL